MKRRRECGEEHHFALRCDLRRIKVQIAIQVAVAKQVAYVLVIKHFLTDKLLCVNTEGGLISDSTVKITSASVLLAQSKETSGAATAKVNPSSIQVSTLYEDQM